MENDSKINFVTKYKKHIIDLYPITTDMVHHISNMKKEDIQEILLCYNDSIQKLLENLGGIITE
jgi:hypothetical protein